MPRETSLPGGDQFMRGLVIGIVVTTVVLATAGTGAAFALRQASRRDVTRCWNLVPVVVAAVDIPKDEVLTANTIAQRQFSEQFITASVVKADEAPLIINRRTQAPLLAGDPIRWGDLQVAK